MLLRVLLLLLLVVTSSGRALTTVHVIPHSHEDPGWIFTSDQYYEQKSKYRTVYLLPTAQRSISTVLEDTVWVPPPHYLFSSRQLSAAYSLD